MNPKFSHFLNQIPDHISQKVETHLANDLALFKPTMILPEPLHTIDYHVIVSSIPLPDAYLGGQLKTFDRGKIVVLNPGNTFISTVALPTKQYYSLLIKPHLINRVAEEMGISGEVSFLDLQNPYSIDLIQAIRNLDKECKHPDSLPLMFDCISVQIAALLLREFKNNRINKRKFSAASPEGKNYVNVAIEYIHTFFSSNIDIEDICREINVSPFHFIRSFKQKTGYSPHQYLLNVRIEKAQELLRTGQYSVSEVAMLCGFVSLPHFSNTFKRIVGYPPSTCRKLFSD